MNAEPYALMVGARVRSGDGHDLGQVKEVVGSYFKVDASIAPDYWLPQAIVESADPSEVILSADRDAIGGYEVEPADLEAERRATMTPDDEARTAVEAAAIVWGPDEWAVVRTRILERESGYSEDELDRMQAEQPEETRGRFGHLFDDAGRSAERLARTVEENT